MHLFTGIFVGILVAFNSLHDLGLHRNWHIAWHMASHIQCHILCDTPSHICICIVLHTFIYRYMYLDVATYRYMVNTLVREVLLGERTGTSFFSSQVFRYWRGHLSWMSSMRVAVVSLAVPQSVDKTMVMENIVIGEVPCFISSDCTFAVIRLIHSLISKRDCHREPE